MSKPEPSPAVFMPEQEARIREMAALSVKAVTVAAVLSLISSRRRRLD